MENVPVTWAIIAVVISIIGTTFLAGIGIILFLWKQERTQRDDSVSLINTLKNDVVEKISFCRANHEKENNNISSSLSDKIDDIKNYIQKNGDHVGNLEKGFFSLEKAFLEKSNEIYAAMASNNEKINNKISDLSILISSMVTKDQHKKEMEEINARLSLIEKVMASKTTN